MGGKGGGGTQTSVQNSEPAKYLKPYLKFAQRRGQSLYNKHELYTDPFNRRQKAGLGEMYAAGRSSRLPQDAADYASAQLGMNPQQQMGMVQDMANPYIEQYVPEANSAAALAGRSGSGMAANVMGEGIGRAVGEQYNNLLGHNRSLAGMSPMIEQGRYMPGQQMFNVGSQYYENTRARREEPWNRFGRYTGLAFGNAPGVLAGGRTTTTSPSQQQGFNPFGALMGVGSMLGGLGWSPFG